MVSRISSSRARRRLGLATFGFVPLLACACNLSDSYRFAQDADPDRMGDARAVDASPRDAEAGTTPDTEADATPDPGPPPQKCESDGSHARALSVRWSVARAALKAAARWNAKRTRCA